MSLMTVPTGQVNATLDLEELELFAGIATADGYRLGQKAKLILREWLKRWEKENPGLVKEMRERGSMFLEDRGGGPRSPEKSGERKAIKPGRR